MRTLRLADSLVTLLEEDPGPVPHDVVEELLEALAGIRWARPELQEHARALVLRLELLKGTSAPRHARQQAPPGAAPESRR